ncbi:serine carboxypeptidase S10 [Heterobasidion irregulare TC 32-1]|uniref:Carboxypeptidase n=1 Tax=Heterobasidion irregulare (strain TC 32-1) TaxID=747525 RepID=W4JRT0_HETIT|nr:serine carboxypeptidase S10 [Heterobasidion irregulare TC 32-1]ETW75785.1 serine carboxypeptidase S10 [Heterobasidion irregulare TC 32-1]
MLLSAALAAALAFPATGFAKQIPVVDGVIGGVGTTSAPEAETLTADASTAADAITPGALRVTENSGICETTPGVYQASGYGDLTSNESIWFWFFAARNNPDTAPLITWFNGGPGSSSMLGLFQELGPCRISNDSSSVALNPYGWNENANVSAGRLFIDQPVGVGFSYGSTTVGTSQAAASDVWKFLQIWFSDSRFSKYASRDFAIWTESYGGHYGPTFAAYFLEQNAKVANGSVSGLPINLKVLGVGDGLTDPLSQYPGYITYAANNPYHPLVSSSVIKQANTSFYQTNGCRARIQNCYNNGTNSVCSSAQSYCNNNVLSPLAGDYDVYYVPATDPDPYPPDLTDYLTSDAVTSKIGAQATWKETSNTVYNNFANTGDWMRNSAPNLETVINAGVRTIIYDGDAVNNLKTNFSREYATQAFSNFTVDGVSAGLYKNAGTFSYVRFFGAGHEVPAYEWASIPRGKAALQMFAQIMADESLRGT